MASSSPSSVKSEPAGALYSAHHQPNLSYTSLFDNSLDNTLPSQTSTIPPPPTSSLIDIPNAQTDEQTFYHLQGYSAPPASVFINYDSNERHGDVRFSGSTTDQPLFAPIDVDHPQHPTTIQRHSSHHPHHYPHHSQNRNRYPYLQRPISSKQINATQVPRTSLDGLPYYEQRPAFRRSYFALRRQRIPKGIEKTNFIENISLFFSFSSSSTNAKTFISWLQTK